MQVSIKALEFSKVAFEFYYLLEKKAKDGTFKTVAHAKTGMVCFDYKNKKVIKPGTKDELIEFEELGKNGGIINLYEAIKLAEKL